MAGLGHLETSIINYVFVALPLFICMAIGIYHGCKDRRNQTPDEYLLGDRKLHLFPVALSFCATFISAISMMGVPAEMYTYGSLYLYSHAGICTSLIFASITIVPLIYPLGVTSAYEYLEMRFKSRSVRLFAASIGMLQTTVYMGITLYAPALALQTVANIPLWISIIIIGSICILYTAIGGIKSVIWTDTFQIFIIFAGTIAVLIKACLDIGSTDTFAKSIEDGKRMQLYDVNFDPRVRHTTWGLVIGGFFSWLPVWCNQSSIQRVSSLRSEKSAKSVFLIAIPVFTVYNAIMGPLGIVLYAYYNFEQCDPLKAGYINNSNQLMLYFVFDVMRAYPGIPGIYISALFSGSLSTISSGINSLAANTVEDLLKTKLVNISKFKVTMLAKAAVVVYGGIAMAFAYIVKSVAGPVIQIVMATFGACGGPVSGLFYLGALFPFANWKGAIAGGCISIIFNLWISIVGVLKGKKAPKLEPNPIVGCNSFNSTLSNLAATSITGHYENTTAIREVSISNDISIYDVSYLWYGFTGFVITFVIGIIVSCITGTNKHQLTEEKLLFPFCRKYFKRHISKKPVNSNTHPNELQELKNEEVFVSLLTEKKD